jgi:hypothetical protein
MNILEFAKCTLKDPKNFKLRTSSGRDVRINAISESDIFPIRGEIVDSVPGHNAICQWDENGKPYNLPLTHGLEIHPFIAEISWKRVDKEVFNKAVTSRNITHHIDK